MFERVFRTAPTVNRTPAPGVLSRGVGAGFVFCRAISAVLVVESIAMKTAKSMFGPGSLLAAGLVMGALACGNDGDPASGPPPSNDATIGADASDDGASDAAAAVCPGPSTFTGPDGGDAQPWTGAPPEQGASCEVLGARWADGCQCGERCECTDSGWSCAYLAC